MAKDDGNTKSKKIDASPSSRSGSADGLRRSGRETPSKKQATESPSSIATRSGRIENQTAPSSSPIKKKPDKMEEQVGPSPLRRSDRGKKQLPPDSSGSKKLVEVPASSNIKLKKEETASSSQQDSVDVSVDNTNDTKSEKQDTDVGGRKRKRMTVRGYKALFKPQRVGLFKPPEVRIEADDGEDPHTQQASPQANASSNGGIESGNGEKQNGGDFLCLHTDDGEDPHTQQAPQANASSNGGIESGNGEKQNGGDFLCLHTDDGEDPHTQQAPQANASSNGGIESGNGEKQNGGKCSLDDNGKIPTGNDVEYCVDSDNHIAHKSPSSECKKNGNDETCIESSKEQRIDDDLESQPDLDTHDKTCDKDLNGTPTFEVRKTPEEAVVMNNNNTENNDEKFVEFWVPVQISNVQLEQYCATLLSEAMALRSNSKNRSFEALHNILTSNRKCCDHPYIVDKDLPIQIVKDQPPDIHWDLSFKTSGKLHFLDLILPEVKKRNLKVVILFQFLPQPTVTPGQKKPVGTGDILDDFACKRFGEDSYTRVDGVGMKKPAIEEAFNKFNTNQNTFIFILEHRHCHSIKLSQVDIVIIFNSDLHPSNDIKALQKISIESNSDNPQKIMIFRLYSKNTLEEKILKLAEQNYTLQNLNRSTCDSLLMFGAKDLFEKLADFHEESGKEISCEEKFLKDVIEEFLVILSNKCLKDGEKMITRVERCGYYGNKNVASREIKKQLVDVEGEQPYVFWRNLLEGKYPRWKFVPVTTSRQRKRPQLLYNFDSSDSIAPVADGAKRRKRSPAAKTVAEKETGGANEGGHSDSQSPPGGHYWSVADSVYDLLKPNVCKLCEILKFPEDVKKTVERFLEFVLANYDVIKEHTTTLQAFVISLGWIGASLSNHEIDRTESFALAKNHFNFNCTEIETDLVYKKLQKAKEEFLGKHDQATSAEPKKSTESQHDQNVEISDESNEETLEVTEKESEEIEEFEREWERKRVNLENDNKVEKSMIRALYTNPSTRSEKLNALEKEFANKLEEHERNKEIQLKQLKQTLLAAEGQVADDNELPQNPETSISVEKQDGGDDEMTETPLELDGGKVQDQSKEKDRLGVGDDIDCIGSYTSEKQMVDAIVSSVPIIVVLPHQHDGIDDDVAVTEEIPEQQNDVEEVVDSVELGVPEVNSNEENAKGDTGGADVAVSVENGEAEVPGGDDEKRNGEDGNISPDTSHAGDEQNDSCGSSSSNQPSAGVPQDDTPSVQLLAPQASDHTMPTILKVIENESLQEQPSNLEIQDKEMQVDPVSLAEIDVVDNLPPVDAQINSEEPRDDQMAEIQSDVNPANEVLPQTICENDANAPEPTTLQSGGNVEEEEQPHLGSDAVNNQQTSEQPIQPETPNRSTLQHEINMFEAQVATRMPTHGDPLQAELDRLCAVNDHVIKFYENTKQRLTSECEKEIAEMMTRITQKYEAKKKEEETVFLSKKKEIDATLKRVVLNKILAEAFRAKCRDHTSSERGMLQVSQSGLMQQLHRSFVRPSFTVPLPSPGQPSERQQTPPPPPSSSPPPQPPPPSQPPLQIVHQPAALFSNTVIRPPPPNNNFRPPASTPPTPTTRPPPNISPTTRPLPTTTPTSRPLPTTTPTSRPLPTTTPTSRPPPTSTPTARPPPNITPVTPATRQPATTTPTARPPPNITPVTPATRPPPSVARSAGSIRAPAPHLRPFKPSTSASPDLSPKIVTVALPVPGQHVTPPPISQPPVLPPLSTSSEPSLPPLPPEASYVPPPPPPSPLPPSASSLQPSQSQPPPPPPPQSPPPQPPPPPPQTHQHGGTEYELLDLTDIFPEDDGAHLSTGHDLVYLSDDD